MTTWYSNVYSAFILAGVISCLIGFITQSQTSIGAYITGYSMFILSILMILIILFSKILNFTKNDSFIKTTQSILMNTGPFILILGVVSFVLYLFIKYKNKIIEGHVAPGYNSFSNIISILLLMQFWVLYLELTKPNNNLETTGTLSRLTTSFIYLIGVLASISSIILYTILKYYSTDGFLVGRRV